MKFKLYVLPIIILKDGFCDVNGFNLREKPVSGFEEHQQKNKN